MWSRTILTILIIQSVFAEDFACNEDNICVRICCKNCTDSDFTTIPGFQNLGPKYSFIFGPPKCPMFQLDPVDYDDDKWSLKANGALQVGELEFDKTIHEYCLEDELGIWRARLCFIDEEELDYLHLSLYPTLILISLPFSITTFLVYALIDDLRNLPGKCLMFYVLSLVLLHIDLALIQFQIPNLGLLCTTMGYLLHFFAFLNILWLNVMSFDIWLVLRNMRLSYDSGARFRNYCIFAFGIPIFIILAMIFVQHYTTFIDLKPDIGQYVCAIKNQTANFIFFIGPLALFSISSIVFIVLAAVIVFRRSKAEDSSGYTRLNAEKDRFSMYLKLFAFLACFWTFEVVSNFYRMPVFIVTDIFNCLQGLAIFVIFVLEKNTRRVVIAKLNDLRNSV